jgi:hypothetical protein
LLYFFLLPPLHAGLVILIGGNVAESQSQAKEWDGMKKPPGVETGFNLVLSVSPNMKTALLWSASSSPAGP